MKVSGAKPIVFDLSAVRLDFCKNRLGIENVLEIKGDGSELPALMEMAGGTLPSVVIDATGSNKSMGTALSYTGFTGRVVYVGLTTQDIAVPHPLMHRREMTLLASRTASLFCSITRSTDCPSASPTSQVRVSEKAMVGANVSASSVAVRQR